ncbi:hypothetical protein PQC57_gp073 [Escherichia phage vB_EcoP_WFI101126]|uniref:Uncharacterized protein n=2 Tax=Kuravirus TaxID=680277 RepID=A0A482MR88_9CAUD|nr:hypothetical protein PQC57_gp073 [Escherichia phage vB_EcoP_WFI101126]QBQ76501.1 hypothetical protein WFI101126_00073 [Escherichia phage vB_EcoP_WFI101126]
MKKMWAVRVVWEQKQHLGKDNIKLFNTRKEARVAKKNMKALIGTVKSADIHRWYEDPSSGSFMSKVIYY